MTDPWREQRQTLGGNGARLFAPGTDDVVDKSPVALVVVASHD